MEEMGEGERNERRRGEGGEGGEELKRGGKEIRTICLSSKAVNDIGVSGCDDFVEVFYNFIGFRDELIYFFIKKIDARNPQFA